MIDNSEKTEGKKCAVLHIVSKEQKYSEMDKTLQVQLQIRQNAEEISSALKDIGSWEKRMKDKDRELQHNAAKATRTLMPRSGGTVPLRSQGKPSSEGNLCFVFHE